MCVCQRTFVPWTYWQHHLSRAQANRASVAQEKHASELTHLSPDHHFNSSNLASVMKTQHEMPNSYHHVALNWKTLHKHTNHSQTIEEYTQTLLFASKLCHHVLLKWKTMRQHTNHLQTTKEDTHILLFASLYLIFTVSVKLVQYAEPERLHTKMKHPKHP